MKAIAAILIFCIGLLSAGESLEGSISVESRLFFHPPQFSEQKRHSASTAIQVEYIRGERSILTVIPFLRLDSADPERTHWDLRECNYLWMGDGFDLRIGIGKVFWGTTEFVHLVDVVNQTDSIESIDGEEKLGQPMTELSLHLGDWGTFEAYLLPYFRERTFPGGKGRLRGALVVDTTQPRYESEQEERHVDHALRYSHNVGNWDLGIHYFSGTGREPLLMFERDETGAEILVPYYPQVDQVGLDLQLVAGQCLWKLEAIWRSGMGDDYSAGVCGLEYTFVGVGDSSADLGVIGELAYDDRREDSTSIFQNDLMVGLRCSVNDAAGTEILIGYVQDVEYPSRVFTLECSRRLADGWTLEADVRLFSAAEKDELLCGMTQDDHARIALKYHF